MNHDMSIANAEHSAPKEVKDPPTDLRNALGGLLTVDRKEFQELAANWERSPGKTLKSLNLEPAELSSYHDYLGDELGSVATTEPKLTQAFERFQNLSDEAFLDFVSRWEENPEHAIEMLGLTPADMPAVSEHLQNVTNGWGASPIRFPFLWFW